MRYKHDCEKCKPLGEFRGADLYFCVQGGLGVTVLARYSDEDSDYASGLDLVDQIPDLDEAKKRAIKAGYILDLI